MLTRILSYSSGVAAYAPLDMSCEVLHHGGQVIAMDVETLCGSRRADGSVVHILQAVVAETRMAHGQECVSIKSNEESPPPPKLIEAMSIAGAIVTIAAMGTQKKILEAIVVQKAQAALDLKGNHGSGRDDCDLPLQSAQRRKTSGVRLACGKRPWPNNGARHKRNGYSATPEAADDWPRGPGSARSGVCYRSVDHE